MKKIMTFILILVFLLGMGSLAYAGTSVNRAGLSADRKAAIQEKIKSMKAIKAEFQDQVAEIRQNRTETLTLRAEARTAHQAAIQHIKDLKASSSQLTDEQIADLKQIKEELKQIKLDLADTKGKIQAERTALKAARQEKNSDQIKTCLDNIIDIQHHRMELIQKSIDEMKLIQEI